MKISHQIKGMGQLFLAESSARVASILHPAFEPSKVRELLFSRLRQSGRLRARNARPRIFFAASINNWEIDLLEPLRALGEVRHFDWTSVPFFARQKEWLNYREEISIGLLKEFDNFHAGGTVDFFVGYCSDFNTKPETLRTIREKGTVVTNFCWDDKLYFKSQYKEQYVGVGRIAPEIDLNLTNAPSSISKYQSVGALAAFWPEGANFSEKSLDSLEVTTDYDALFIGGRYGWRGEFIDELIKRGVKVLAYGTGWPNGPAAAEVLAKLYRMSPLVLGFAGVGYSSQLMCLKGRDFEVPAAGALYLTQHNPELNLVYKIGEEILTYSSLDDCIRKISWVKANPEKARAIRFAGYERVKKNHLWVDRFNWLLDFCTT